VFANLVTIQHCVRVVELLSLRKKNADSCSSILRPQKNFSLAEIVHDICALLTDSAQYHNNSYVLRDRVGIGMICNIIVLRVGSLFEFKVFNTGRERP